MGEIWGVFRELYKEKWPRYIESALYNDFEFECEQMNIYAARGMQQGPSRDCTRMLYNYVRADGSVPTRVGEATICDKYIHQGGCFNIQ